MHRVFQSRVVTVEPLGNALYHLRVPRRALLQNSPLPFSLAPRNTPNRVFTSTVSEGTRSQRPAYVRCMATPRQATPPCTNLLRQNMWPTPIRSSLFRSALPPDRTLEGGDDCVSAPSPLCRHRKRTGLTNVRQNAVIFLEAQSSPRPA